MPSRKEKKVKARARERELYDMMMSSTEVMAKTVPRGTPNCARVGLDDDNRTYAAGPNGERQPIDTLKSMKDANPDPNPIDRAAYRDITHARLADKMGTDRIVTDPLWGSKDTGIGPMDPAERKRHMERQDRIKHSVESPYSTANMKTPAIPEGLKGEEQMSAWIAQNRVELVANLMEGEIGEALAQSSAPKQSDAKVIDSKGRARNRLKLSEFMEEQEQQQMQLGRRKTQEELEDGLRISVYERKLQTCASKHFWSWHPDVRLSAFWNNLPEPEKDEITSMDSEEEKEDMFRRIKAHKGRVCFSALDPLQTAKDKRFFDDKESLFIYTEMFRTAVTKNAPLAVTQQVVDIVHKVILSILVQMDVPCGAHVQPGTYEYMAEHTTEHIRLLSMAEMLYLFEERLITKFHTQGPGKTAQAEAEAAADAMMAELLALEDNEGSSGGSKGKKGGGKNANRPQSASANGGGGGAGGKKKKGKKGKKGRGAGGDGGGGGGGGGAVTGGGGSGASGGAPSRSGGGGGLSGRAGGGGGGDDKYLQGIADAMAADRRSRKVVDASGIGGGADGRSVLTELCTQLKNRLTQQMTGKPAAPIKVRSKEEVAEREAAMDDFSKMLAEAKLAEGSAPEDEDDPINEEDDNAICRECDTDAGHKAVGSYLMPDD